ncbi:MAG: hypothetical protein GWN18_04865, partial [Thermoplasmata archaeon]|nr:hypothetical protein [Thermoplasmata archaeon]NIU48425.1 hypothetical protein [Thermoplasmata archaeon]NIV78886.1 hypothetical protein [Thermoplasmata archaeon]NIW81909.1 hypothetical protein [Thermoplasmata archaeon]
MPEEDDRGFVRKTFAAMSRGALEAVDETVDFVTPGLDVNLFADEGEDGLLFNLPKAPEGIGYGLVEGFTQFGVGMLGAGKFLKATGLARRAALGTSRILRGTQG